MGALGWHPGGPLRVRAVPCSASEDFMFYLEMGDVLGKIPNLNLDTLNSPFD